MFLRPRVAFVIRFASLNWPYTALLDTLKAITRFTALIHNVGSDSMSLFSPLKKSSQNSFILIENSERNNSTEHNNYTKENFPARLFIRVRINTVSDVVLR